MSFESLGIFLLPGLVISIILAYHFSFYDTKIYNFTHVEILTPIMRMTEQLLNAVKCDQAIDLH
jgi:hypothetical protein